MTDKLTPGQLRDLADLCSVGNRVVTLTANGETTRFYPNKDLAYVLREEAARREATQSGEWQTLVDPDTGCPYRVPPSSHKPAPAADDLVKRLRRAANLRGGFPENWDEWKAADRIETETARADRAEERMRALEALRPLWAMGHTSDSIAAQTSAAALSQIWAALGVSNQTAAMDVLRALKAENARLRDALTDRDNPPALEPGQIWRTHWDSLVRLERPVPGDGTKWFVSIWWNGSWACMDEIVEPSDLNERKEKPDADGGPR